MCRGNEVNVRRGPRRDDEKELYFRRSNVSGWKTAHRKPSSRLSASRRTKSPVTGIIERGHRPTAALAQPPCFVQGRNKENSCVAWEIVQVNVADVSPFAFHRPVDPTLSSTSPPLKKRAVGDS